MALSTQSHYVEELRGNMLPRLLQVPADWRDASAEMFREYQSDFVRLWTDLASTMQIDPQNLCELSEEEFRREIILERLRLRYTGNSSSIVLQGNACIARVWSEGISTNLHILTREKGEHFEVVLLHWPLTDAMNLAREIVDNFRLTDWSQDAVQRSNSRTPLAVKSRAYSATDNQKD